MYWQYTTAPAGAELKVTAARPIRTLAAIPVTATDLIERCFLRHMLPPAHVDLLRGKDVETVKSIRRQPNVAALQVVSHAVVVGIIMLITRAHIDAASVLSTGGSLFALLRRS